MQGGGAVAVQSRLGITRGAAGVAHARCRVLVKHRPLVAGALAAHPCFVADEVRYATIGWQFVGIAHRYPMFDRGALAVHGLDDGQEGHVKADHLVFGMVGNPCNLFWVQTWVDGVEHAATAADAKVQL